jgi:hypothetical protein
MTSSGRNETAIVRYVRERAEANMTFVHKHMPELDKLWVVTCISNPARYESRYRIFKHFKESMDVAKVNLMVIELAFGDRPFEIEAENVIQLRTNDELWNKENLINIAVSRLPADWKYVAWIDADIEFIRHDWAEETVHQLQHHKVIQMFQTAVDLGPKGEVYKVYDSFMYSYITGQPKPYSKGAYPHWHPGFAYAMTREAFNDVGGLIDFAILGSADHHMAHALIGNVKASFPKTITEAYKEKLKIWEERANIHINKNVGYMNGTIVHHWHGKKSDRRYISRWSILTDNKFNPDLDIKKDWQGLNIFTDNGNRMRADIQKYFRVRDEDSIDLE